MGIGGYGMEERILVEVIFDTGGNAFVRLPETWEGLCERVTRKTYERHPWLRLGNSMFDMLTIREITLHDTEE